MRTKKRPPQYRTDVSPPEASRGQCPFCRAGFLQRDTSPSERTPGWVCDNPDCGYRVLADDLIRASREHNAHARRGVMKARAVVARVNRRIARMNEQLKNRKRSA